MPSKEDWIVGGVIVAVLAVLGITVYVVSKKKSSGYALKKISSGQPILSNYERVQMVRDREGNLSEMIIHREIHE